MIGSYATDASMVYGMNKDHELYRQWIPLMDDEDPEDVGVQGYMKITIAVSPLSLLAAFTVCLC
jgi:hypothetical protein